ncbi:MAG: hypothetical protein ACYDDF_07995 [Thermoplasmatota archaeon]
MDSNGYYHLAKWRPWCVYMDNWGTYHEWLSSSSNSPDSMSNIVHEFDFESVNQQQQWNCYIDSNYVWQYNTLSAASNPGATFWDALEDNWYSQTPGTTDWFGPDEHSSIQYLDGYGNWNDLSMDYWNQPSGICSTYGIGTGSGTWGLTNDIQPGSWPQPCNTGQR